MGIRPIDKCNKGDIEKTSIKLEILKFEICVEQSFPNEHDIIIRMWEKEDNKFQIERYDKKKQGEERFEKLRRYAKYSPEAKAWREYEHWCEVYRCSPYPEADYYYENSEVGRERIKKILGQ